MASLEEIRSARLSKLQFLIDKGINPYPAKTYRDLSCLEASTQFDELVKSGKSLYMVGRIMSVRSQGKISFLDINDGTGRFQALLKREEPLREESFELFKKAFDIGDFVEVKGTFFLTKKDEKTILVEELRMLAKSLRPLPEKWHGLSDVEERFRKRYLDLLSNSEVKERFILRTKVVTEIRKILDEAGYLEVETPVLQPLYGGASAEPFITYHKALDTNLYLRISDELYLKRLLAAGLPKVYEIARDFRNEGIDVTHNPEFTMLEFYEAYSNATEQRAFVEDMMRKLVFLSNSQGKITFNGHEIDFSKPFKVMKYADAIAEQTQLGNPLKASLAELVKEADRLGSKVETRDNAMKVLDAVFKKVRPAIIQPTFLVDYPIDMLPLTKRKEDNPKLVDAFQLYAGGVELVKAFSELNDPIDQRERFEVQEKNKEEGDKEAQLLDEDFLEAMEYGIPPAGGVGIGIDRLVMLLTGVKNIKEVILFPTLKPKEEKKSKELLSAVAIINSGVGMEKWQELNTIAHLTAALGAREGKGLFYKNTIQTKDGENIFLNIRHAILIKKADSNKKLRTLLKEALRQKLKVAEFTREMLETTNDKKVEENTKNKLINDIEFLGVLIFGSKKVVDDLTKDLELYQ